MAESVTVEPRHDATQLEVLADQIATLNGASIDPDAWAQVLKLAFGPDSAATTVDDTTGKRLPVSDPIAQVSLAAIVNALAGTLIVRSSDGTFAYRAGAVAATIDVPDGARIKRVAVLASAAAGATLQILGGDVITIPAGEEFDDQLPGSAIAVGSTEIVIGGTVQAYYVSWVA